MNSEEATEKTWNLLFDTIFVISIIGYIVWLYLIFNGVEGSSTSQILVVPFFFYVFFIICMSFHKYPKSRNIAKRFMFFMPVLAVGYFIPYYLFSVRKNDAKRKDI